jgi:hypothetical protein
MEYTIKLPDNFEIDEDKFYLGIIGSDNITNKQHIYTSIENVLTMVDVKFDIPKNCTIIITKGDNYISKYASEYAIDNNLDSVNVIPINGTEITYDDILKNISYLIIFVDNINDDMVNIVLDAIDFKVPHMVITYED